jgi:non-ribosomal peptide synthetase component E (peptide arylation enzyme)
VEVKVFDAQDRELPPGETGEVVTRSDCVMAGYWRNAEATAQAREAAAQFARDAESRLGGIRRANQGVFEILPREQAAGIREESQVFKTLRVVSTVEFLLRD